MAPYDDWNKIDDEEEEELQDNSVSARYKSKDNRKFTFTADLGRQKGRDSVRYRLLAVNVTTARSRGE